MLQIKRSLSNNAWIACVPNDAQGHFALVEQPADGARPIVRWLAQHDWSDARHAWRQARRSGPLRQHRCVALLQRTQYQMLPMDAPDVPRDEWRQAVRWKLKDVVDFPVDTACLDVLEVPAAATSRRQAALIAVAAPEAPLRELVAAAEDAGVRLHALDVPETALRNLSGLLATPGRAHALLHIGRTHGTLVITMDGELLLSRQIDVNELQMAETEVGARQVAFDRAALELQRTLDGFERSFTATTLERVHALPGPGMSAFCDFARDLVYVPMAEADLAGVLDFGEFAEPAQAVESLSTYWVAIGAALRP